MTAFVSHASIDKVNMLFNKRRNGLTDDLGQIAVLLFSLTSNLLTMDEGGLKDKKGHGRSLHSPTYSARSPRTARTVLAQGSDLNLAETPAILKIPSPVLVLILSLYCLLSDRIVGQVRHLGTRTESEDSEDCPKIKVISEN
jgi:hypothetical protein